MKKIEAAQVFGISRNTIELWRRSAETRDFQAACPVATPGNGHWHHKLGKVAASLSNYTITIPKLR
ncbi:hypothetical protein QUA35_24070 [Microcoleus sp. N9_B2]|uniref:hypothetical protein n=1 Tax=unclassified Microcoleus TaxID=2642155 RepID=UPI002FD32C70